MNNKIKSVIPLLVGSLMSGHVYAMEGFSYDGSQTVSPPSSSSTSYSSTSRVFTAPDNSLYTISTNNGGTYMDFDGGEGVDLYPQGTYLTKKNPDGSYAWTTLVNAFSITADASGNIYISGVFSENTDLDPTAGEDYRMPAGTRDLYITKLNADLSYGWSKTIGSTGAWMESGDIAVDTQGNIIVTGSFKGTVDFDFSSGVDEYSSIYNGNLNTQDLFTAKINNDGSYGWTQVYATTRNETGSRVVLDESSNSYVMSRINSGYGSPANIVTLLKYDSAGTLGWSGSITGYTTVGSDLAINGDALYISGSFSNVTDFDPTSGVDSITTAINSAFLTKVNTDGSYGWTRAFGDTTEIYGNGVAANNIGDVFIVGSYRNTADFDPSQTLEEHTSTAYFDIFYSHYKSDGSYMGTTTIGWNANDYANGATTDSNNNFYLVGQANGSAFPGPGSGDWDFDPGTGVDVRIVNGNGSGYTTKWKSNSAAADISLSNVSTIPTAFYRGETLTFSATVDNTGGQAVNDVAVDYYLSTDTTIDSNDYLLSRGTIATIAAGQSGSLDVDALIDMPVGSYYLGAIVDPDNTIVEGNENNNTLLGSLVDISLSPKAEQVVTALTAPSQIGLQGKFKVQFTLTNFGSVAASGYGNGRSYWGVYLSPDPEITTSDMVLTTGNIYQQAPQTSVDIERTLTLPSSVTTGPLYVGVITDYLNGVSENDENNNTAAALTNVVTSDVDLYIPSSLSSNPRTIVQNQYTRLFGSVSNAGSSTITNVTLNYYFSTDANITTDDYFVGSETISSIGGLSGVSTAHWVQANVPPGEYYLGAIVDADNVILETNEENNSGVGWIVTVVP